MMVQKEALKKPFPLSGKPFISFVVKSTKLPISSKPSLTVHTVFIFGIYLQLDSFGGLIVLL